MFVRAEWRFGGWSGTRRTLRDLETRADRQHDALGIGRPDFRAMTLGLLDRPA